MALMKWDDTLSVHVECIDEQHKKLVNLLNRIHDAARAGTGQQVAGSVLDELFSYTQDHFAFEEDLMRRADYPDRDPHVEEHARLTARVSEWQAEFAKGGDAVAQQLTSFLVTWLSEHIMDTDKRYTPYLQGLDAPPAA